MKNKFCERFNLCLKNQGISQYKFAKMIGMSQSVVNNYATGKREPSLDTLIVISKALDESADYLLGLTDF